MQITTKVQAKTVVSALRREIKALGKGPEQLSHNDCLTLTAKALGFASWNAWEASLLDAATEKPVAAVSKYPLVNNGDFDFVSPGVHGKAFSGHLAQLVGTDDTVCATALVTSVARDGSEGELDLSHEGSSDVDWDSQKTRKNKQGFDCWLDDSADVYSQSQLVIAPEDCYDPFDDEELAIRPKLIQAFLDYFADSRIDAIALDGIYDTAEEVIGFTLTVNEVAELRAKVEALANNS